MAALFALSSAILAASDSLNAAFFASSASWAATLLAAISSADGGAGVAALVATTCDTDRGCEG